MNPSNLSMNNFVMANGHHSNGIRMSPQQSMPPHMQHVQNLSATRHSPSNGILPSVSAGGMILPHSNVSTMSSPSSNLNASSPAHSLGMRSPNSPPMSPEKSIKSVDLTECGMSDDRIKDNALNMTVTANGSNISANTDIRTNSIAALRIKAKEHLENINKSLTMV